MARGRLVSLLCGAAGAAAGSLWAARTAQAGSLYWDTNGSVAGSANSTTSSWGVDNFWTADPAGTNATSAYIAGSDVFFSAGSNATGTNTIAVSGVQSANSITLEEGVITIGTAGSGGLELGAGGLTLNSGLHGNAVLSTNLGSGILLTASQQWNNNTTTRVLTVNAVVNGSATTGNTQTLTINDAGGTTSLGGGITNGSNGGNVALVKGGGGKLTLAANNNTYSGGTTINGGILQFGTGSNAVPATGSIIINAGASLAAAGPGTLSTVQGWLDSGKITTGSAGIISLNSSTSSAAINFATGGYNSLFLGANVTSTYTGTLTPGSNGYRLGGGGATLTVNSLLDQATTLTVSNSANVILGGDNTYSGQTTVSSGTLIVAHANALGSTAAGTVVSSGASVAVDNGVTTNALETVTISGAGSGSFGALTTRTGASGTWAGNVVLGSPDVRIGARTAQTLVVTGQIQGSGGNQALRISGESGTGTVIIATPASYTGNTVMIRGKLLLGVDNALPTTTVLDLHELSATSDTSTFDLNGFNQTLAGIRRSTTNAATTITNSLAGPVKTLTVNQATAADYGSGTTGSNSGSITGNLALIKGGAAQLTLSAANSYTGGTTVSAGVLSATANSALGSGDVTVQSTATKLSLGGSVSDAIANAALLTLQGGGASNTADAGFLDLSSGANETVGSLMLGGELRVAGTYGSTSTAAQFRFDEYFSGSGIVTNLGLQVPEPGALGLVGAAALLSLRRRRRR